MKQIRIADATLCREDRSFSFKERLEIIRQLERLNCDIIELPEIENAKVDTLMVRTASSLVKKSILSVAAGSTEESINNAAAALSIAKRGRIRITLPTSSVGMEYFMHKKEKGMLEWIEKCVRRVKTLGFECEFCAVDATRADREFLKTSLKSAQSAGVDSISLCDSAAGMLPDDFAAFVKSVTEEITVPVGVFCSDKNGLASAEAIMSVCAGVTTVKTTVGGDGVSLEGFASMVKNCGDSYGFCSKLAYTELRRIISQINWISGSEKIDAAEQASLNSSEDFISLDAADDAEAVKVAVTKLGYDLSDDDCKKVAEEIGKVAEGRRVGAKELEAIVASVALQVPDSYKLQSYVVNNGNIIRSSAQIFLEKDGTSYSGVALGGGPVEAAFLAIEQIIGNRYELDDFQIQSVTEGREAIGSAVVKLRSEGKLYSGKGISADIIGASIKAYISAVNKIVYEEENA